MAPELSYRADIDGLRAIAVLSVIGFHAYPNLFPGGFVGVDVFFVISGFLIGSLILTELKNRSFSFIEFYGRRARRLFPALICVLLVVWGVGFFIFLPSEFAALGNHILAGAGFGANILLYSETGYFDVPAVTKPLLHLWSLGVEEQFYIIFPGLLALIWIRRFAGLFLALIAIASFVFNIAAVHKDVSLAFYMPFTRFWEFLAGALLAYTKIVVGALPASDQRPASRMRDISSILGLFLIGVAIFFLPVKGLPFPGWLALLPVFGATLFIGAGPSAWPNGKVFTNSCLVFIGLISYPLYLWHWPLLIMGRAIMWDHSPSNVYPRTTANIVIALSLLLAWLTYRFIERPIRTRRPLVAMRWITTATVACLAVVAALGFVTARGAGLPSRYPADIRALLAPLTFGAGFPPPDPARNTDGPLLVTFGDSNARHLEAGFRMLQKDRKFRFTEVPWGDCGPAGWVTVVKDVERCRRWKAANDENFRRLKPDIVVIAAAWFQYNNVPGIAEAISFFKSIGVRRIVLLGGVPLWEERSQVLLYRAYRGDPFHRIPTRLTQFSHITIEVDHQIKEIALKSGATYISIYDVLCNEDGCLGRVGNFAKDIVQVDQGHLSAAGSWYIIKHVADRIFD
jgi:peptidoglycan/LPS O-acetylase OafA/YrhL